MSEYIGRRIVPVHGGVWSGSKSYEELTIVLHEDSGDSYISRRAVPAGTAITDETYWMLHSLYSQQIADAVAQMEATETRLKTVETRLDANVSASTDADADYAAEVVDARVDNDGNVYSSLGTAVRGQIASSLRPLAIVNSSNYEDVLPTIDVTFRGYYTIESGTISLLDGTFPENVSSGTTVFVDFSNSTGLGMQLMIQPANTWVRSHTSSKYNVWKAIAEDCIAEVADARIDSDGNDYSSLGDAIREQHAMVFKLIGIVTSHNYEEVLPSLDVCFRGYYVIQYGTVDLLEGTLPDGIGTNTTVFIDLTGSDNTGMQLLIQPSSIWIRSHTSSKYNSWSNILEGYAKEESPLFVSGTDNLVKALKENTNEVVYVYGDHDLIQEYIDVYGDDFWEDTESTYYNKDLRVQDRIMYFSPTGKITCNYTGDNEQVKKTFAPINCAGYASGNLHIEGLFMEVSGVRYPIHDDAGGTGRKNARHVSIIRNCHLINNNEAGYTPACIGGGYGHCSDILVEGCIIEGALDGTLGISYHTPVNDEEGGHSGMCLIRNNVLLNKTIRIAGYTGVDNSYKAIVCGNITNGIVYHSANNLTYENEVQMYAFNNIVDGVFTQTKIE